MSRQLEAEIQSEKSNAERTEKELRHELQKLQEDNERQQKLLSQVTRFLFYRYKILIPMLTKFLILLNYNMDLMVLLIFRT